MSAPRIDLLTTRGTFSLDGGTWEVENNLWALGDDEECVLIDAPHSLDAMVEIARGRKVKAILCTHAHDDHINQAVAGASRLDSEVYLHRDDVELWSQTLPSNTPDHWLSGGESISVGGIAINVLHTPGHSPGGVCYYVPALNTAFSGDTLFQGGPGATGRSFSSFPLIIESITKTLLTLPQTTEIRPGHGGTTTIALEAPQLQSWIDRGH